LLLIDFELSGTQGDINVQLSGYDRRDMVPMLGYIVLNNILPSQIKRYFMNAFQKSYGCAMCRQPEDVVLKLILINPNEIRFTLERNVKGKRMLRIIKNYAAVDITKMVKYDWGDDEEVFNYIESDERFQEPEIISQNSLRKRGK
jgi:hypothetical protein